MGESLAKRAVAPSEREHEHEHEQAGAVVRVHPKASARGRATAATGSVSRDGVDGVSRDAASSAKASSASSVGGHALSLVAFRDQDFYKLRAELFKQGRLFEDGEFPASDRSIYFDEAPNKKIEWKRPHVRSLPLLIMLLAFSSFPAKYLGFRLFWLGIILFSYFPNKNHFSNMPPYPRDRETARQILSFFLAYYYSVF